MVRQCIVNEIRRGASAITTIAKAFVREAQSEHGRAGTRRRGDRLPRKCHGLPPPVIWPHPDHSEVDADGDDVERQADEALQPQQPLHQARGALVKLVNTPPGMMCARTQTGACVCVCVCVVCACMCVWMCEGGNRLP
jgi:hypothetical protein